METLNITWSKLYSLRSIHEKYGSRKQQEDLEQPGIYIFGYSKDNNHFSPQYVGKADNLRTRIIQHLMSLQAGYELTYWEDEANYYRNIPWKERLDYPGFFHHRPNNKLTEGQNKSNWLDQWNEIEFLWRINNEDKIAFQKRLEFYWKHFRITFAFCENQFSPDKLTDVERTVIRSLGEDKLQNQQFLEPKVYYKLRHNPCFKWLI